MPASTFAAYSGEIVARFSHVWWLYALSFISTAVGALLCYVQLRPHRLRSFRDLAGFVFPKRVLLHRSVRLDLWFLLVRRLTSPWIVAPFLLSSAAAAHWIAIQLTLLFGPPAPMTPSLAAAIGLTLLVLVASDFAIFISHFLQHRIPVLWEFHKVHHAAPVLIPATVLRIHPIDEIGRGLCISLCNAAVGSVFLYFYPAGVEEVAVVGLDAYFVLDLLIFNQLRHSHLPLRFGGLLESVFISPALHQLHHSVDPRHHGKNYGFTFAIWDRLLGTLVRPDNDTVYELGLSDGEHLAYDSVWAFYTLPFVRLCRRAALALRGRPAASAGPVDRLQERPSNPAVLQRF